MSTSEENETMITAGIYQKGTSAEIDEAIEMHPAIEEFLMQEEEEMCTMEDTLKKLSDLSGIEIPESEYDENAGNVKETQPQDDENSETPEQPDSKPSFTDTLI
jgi:hypothetical protein